MSFGPISLLVPSFPALLDSPSDLKRSVGRPALLDSPSDLIRSVGHKSEVRRACPVEALRRRRNLEPKSYF